jgi:hypothetical protein
MFSIFQTFELLIASTGAPKIHVTGCVDGWVGVKAVLRIAYSNQK